jgi:hypothetical protein
VSSGVSGDSFEEAVEEGGSVGLVVVAGVVSLAQEDEDELGSGLEGPARRAALEVGAGLAGGFHAAVELGGSGAEPVAEYAGVGLLAEPGHGGGLDLERDRPASPGDPISSAPTSRSPRATSAIEAIDESVWTTIAYPDGGEAQVAESI